MDYFKCLMIFFFGLFYLLQFNLNYVLFLCSCNSKSIASGIIECVFIFTSHNLNDRFTRDFVSIFSINKNRKHKTFQIRKKKTWNKNSNWQIKKKTIKITSFHHLQWFFCPSIWFADLLVKVYFFLISFRVF